VVVYEITGLGPLRTRFQGAAGSGFGSIRRRQREIEAMTHLAGLAKGGHGQIVAIIGEPSIGKSREKQAHERLLNGVSGKRVKPPKRPQFPGGRQAVQNAPLVINVREMNLTTQYVHSPEIVRTDHRPLLHSPDPLRNLSVDVHHAVAFPQGLRFDHS
jgi:hypothetical protein